MKNKYNSLSAVFIVSVFSLCCYNQSYGQEKFNIAGGFGFPDLLNLGARYQIKQDTLQLGISLGLADYERAISGDLFYHFGGRSGLSNRPPWYFKGGITLLSSYQQEEESSEYAPILNIRLGRDLNISKRIGMNLEGGLGYSPFVPLLMEESKIIPGFGLYFFYRFI